MESFLPKVGHMGIKKSFTRPQSMTQVWNRRRPPASASLPSLLDIPVEIRLHLYTLMLSLSSRDHLNLMLVCQQVYLEAKESYFQRSLTCHSQDEMIRFVQSRSGAFLKQMTNLHLRLQEVDGELMHPYLARAIQGISTPSERHPYVLETNRLLEALSMVPNISRLRLSGPRDASTSIPSSIFTTSILKWAENHYHALESLRIDLESCLLTSLAHFTKLKALHLTGFSETNAMDVSELCSRLRSLEELTLSGPPLGLQMRHRHGCQGKIVQSVNHHVFERIQPLKRLVIEENAEPDIPGVFLTVKTLKSLHDRHRDSLRVLRISSKQPLQPSVLSSLESLLTSAHNIQELRLVWPNLQTSLLDHIPSSTHRLEVAITSPNDAQEIANHLRKIRHRLPYLKQANLEYLSTDTITNCPGQDERDPGQSASLTIILPPWHQDI